MDPFDEPGRPSGEWPGVGSFSEGFALDEQQRRQSMDADKFFGGSWGDANQGGLEYGHQSLDAQSHPHHGFDKGANQQFQGYDDVGTVPFGDGGHHQGHMNNGGDMNAADNSSTEGDHVHAGPGSHESPFGSFQEGGPGSQMPVTNGPQERTVKSGWLRKKPSAGWGWRKRWFVLSNARLCYYTSPNNLGVQKIIAFDRAGLNVRTGSDLTELVLRCHQRTLVLKAQSQWECAQWIIAFQIVADELSVWGPPGGVGAAPPDAGGGGGGAAPLQEYGGSSVGLHKAQAAAMNEQQQGTGSKVKRKMQDMVKFGGFFSGSERAAKMASPPPSREGSEHLSLDNSFRSSMHGATVHGATVHGTSSGPGQAEHTRGGVRSLDNSLHGQDLYHHTHDGVAGAKWGVDPGGQGSGAIPIAQQSQREKQDAMLSQAAASLENFVIHDGTAPVPINRHGAQGGGRDQFGSEFGGSPMMGSYGQSPGILPGSFGQMGQSPGSAMWLAESPGQRGMSLLGTPQERGGPMGMVFGESPASHQSRGMSILADSPADGSHMRQQMHHGGGGPAQHHQGSPYQQQHVPQQQPPQQEQAPATEEGIAVPLPRIAAEQLDALPSGTRASLIAQIENQQAAGSQSPRVVRAGRQAMELALRFLGSRLYQPRAQFTVSQVLDAALGGFLEMIQGGQLEVKAMSSAFLTSTVLRGIIVKHQIADTPWPLVVSDPNPLQGQKLAGEVICSLLPYVDMAPEADMLPPVLLPDRKSVV